MNISPELWHQIDPLLSEALDMDEGNRDAWLRRLDDTHPQLTPFLRKILASHERAERSQELETVPKLAPAPPASSIFSSGTRIGPFALLRPLGRGGMGEVWLARQVDGRVERMVALKLPMIHQHSEVWRERFSRERDILAKLTHANIARLFDAGVSDENNSRGQPFLAMEHVEGQSLTDFVAAQKSTITERLQLFLQILAAVAHAHRHLVVHRDLKPANILIDKSGQVKLLDFGIAKLLDEGIGADATPDLTQLGGRVMTLRYAAPEQVAEGAISTATDAYALGVILHELLTGLSPYRAVREQKIFTESALLNAEPALPSALGIGSDAASERKASSPTQLAKQISGDLDAILLKAMRRDPLDRYTSIDHFDDDIRRHLESRPVRAREGTWRYLAGRFLVRNKLPIATATGILLTLIVGLVMVEQQRRVAVAEKARAEKHFASVRKLANSFILDLNDQIEDVPGATKVRLLLVENATRYLDQLSTESSGDAELQIEVANAYGRLGDILGATYGQSVGRHEDALKQYDKAISLLTPHLAEKPARAAATTDTTQHSVAAAREMIMLLERKSHILYEKSRAADATEANRQAYEMSKLRVASKDANIDDKLIHSRLHVAYTRRIAGAKRDPQIRMQGLKDAFAIVDAVRLENATHPRVLEEAAQLDYELGSALRRDPRPEVKREAIVSFERSLAIRERQAEQNPDDAIRLRTIAGLHNSLGTVLLDLGENSRAFYHLSTLLKKMQALADRDPGNLQFQRDLADAEASIVRAYVALRQYDDALMHVQKSKKRLEQMPAENSNLLMTRVMRARLNSSEGEAHFNLAKQHASSDRRVSQLGRAKVAFLQSQTEYRAIEAEPQKPFSLASELAKIDVRINDVNSELRLASRP